MKIQNVAKLQESNLDRTYLEKLEQEFGVQKLLLRLLKELN